MKYFPLIWATLWRKKTRTIFTLLSVVVAFLLFGMLETVDYAFSHPSGGVTGAGAGGGSTGSGNRVFRHGPRFS